MHCYYYSGYSSELQRCSICKEWIDTNPFALCGEDGNKYFFHKLCFAVIIQ